MATIRVDVTCSAERRKVGTLLAVAGKPIDAVQLRMYFRAVDTRYRIDYARQDLTDGSILMCPRCGNPLQLHDEKAGAIPFAIGSLVVQ